ncbi:hypothetical protein PtA15_11A365 [Puccinia triticina]|uniref:Uncharacterized protein n=1 Tax=Puccinia triticina TaxID=208348 RepID=A0ABY7CWK9_9BASI|nr:uncharacterized protein PtA15_11A365 [Puccinia triticina]WAQ89674.1 hypothetical protein PtA15_11A365 [Puccinia triticina]WAR59709.1 hypothetical protein PtB15_11B349 [Puccinia triticina]
MFSMHAVNSKISRRLLSATSPSPDLIPISFPIPGRPADHSPPLTNSHAPDPLSIVQLRSANTAAEVPVNHGLRDP